MGRTIKFRAYDSATGKVSEPFDVKESWGDYLIDFEDYSTDGALDSIIWEQFTGLLDRNGKEIYEGDIVRLYDRFVSAITWQDDCCGFRWYDNSGDGYCGLSKDNEEYYEVIGNIHENPELLGGEE